MMLSIAPRPISITDAGSRVRTPKKSSTIRSGELVRKILGAGKSPEEWTSICSRPPGRLEWLICVMTGPSSARTGVPTMAMARTKPPMASFGHGNSMRDREIIIVNLHYVARFQRPARIWLGRISHRPETPRKRSSISSTPSDSLIATILPLFWPRYDPTTT